MFPYLQNLILVVFLFCCILHGISFAAAMAQLYQKSIGYDILKTQKARAS